MHHRTVHTDPHEHHHRDLEHEFERVSIQSPYTRNLGVLRFQQAIYVLFAVIEVLIAIRFVLRALGANPAAAFSAAIYTITAPFVGPFVGIFGTLSFERSVFEPHSAIALLLYPLLGWLIAQLVWLFLADTRADISTVTHASRTEDERDTAA